MKCSPAAKDFHTFHRFIGDGIKIKFFIGGLVTLKGVVAVLIGVTLAVGALGYYATQRAVGLLEGMSLRAAHQQSQIGNLMLHMETNRSQLLQALQHNTSTDFAKMHDHPLDVHFKNIADNTRALEQARDEFNALLDTPDAKELVR